MRYPVVLFDLDGTLIDSGPIILASMRHASLTVLGREPDEELVRAAIGGPGLIAQMRDLDPDRVDELVEVYRAHNEPLHETLESFTGILELLPVLRDEGRTLGIVTAKRGKTVGARVRPVPGAARDDGRRHRRRGHRAPQARPRPAARGAAAPRRRRRRRRSTSATRRSTSGPRRRPGVGAIAVGWGGIHPDERLLAEEPDALVHTAEELHGLL